MRTPPTPDLSLEFRAVTEDLPGPKLAELFGLSWSAYRAWIDRRTADGPPAEECVARLREHMPELLPTFEQILAVIGSDDLKPRFLSLWSPTPIIRGCSQLVIEDECGPVLVRNYDHAPALCDGIVLATKWGGVGVHAMTDCLWGALDGVNEHGLVVALAFGGEQTVGPGFAASLIVRYLLQTCETVAQAKKQLDRLPLYMSYTFTMLDRTGDRCTAFTGPDRDPEFVTDALATNHQSSVRWAEYAEFTGTIERKDALESIAQERARFADVIDAFMRPPLFRRDYRRGSGTLYTAAYDPASMEIDLFWPGQILSVAPGDEPGAQKTVGYRSG